MNKKTKITAIFVFSFSLCFAQTVPPKVTLLDTCKKPNTIPLPKTKDGKVTVLLSNGQTREVELTPVETIALPVLKNKKGEIIKDKDGNQFILGENGGASAMQTYTTDNGLAMDAISYGHKSALCDSRGNLWFGTDGGGVSRYDGKSFTNFTTAQGLANNTVLSITEDKTGNLWFGTAGGGVSRYNGKSFTNFTTNDGLPDDVVTQVVFDNQQNIIIGTNFGVGVLSSFTPKLQGKSTQSNLPAQNNLNNGELKNYTPVFEIYNSKTGYPVKDVNAGQNAMYKDSKGIIWIATGADKTGLVRFDPSAINKNQNPPTVIIQNIKINEENISFYNLTNETDSAVKSQQEIMTYGKLLSNEVRDSITKKFSDIQFDGITKFYPLPEHLVLPYRHNHITFEFTAIEPARPYLVKYQYTLEGLDKEWSPVTNKTNAEFGNLWEGTYTFKLKAQSPFGVWSEPITYTFRVLPPWYRTIWMYAVYIILLIGIIILIVWWNGRRLRARAKELETEIKKATHTIAEKQKEIIDSITYAKRIQKAMLPHRKDIWAAFPNSFVLFKPKDIVSGDFYFFQKNDKGVFIASADCTGHGVPGAFMSMIGSDKLNDAVSESSDTSEILSLLNKAIKTTLKQSDSDESTRDGMDIALCSVDTNARIVKYAGANRPIWIIRNGQTVVEEIKATKKAIGGFTEDNQHFDSHEIKFQQGDTFYISTDGYADTFGGQGNKKVTTKRFKDILLSIQDKTMKEQEKHLDDFIENWKGGTEQVDDILVIGIRL